MHQLIQLELQYTCTATIQQLIQLLHNSLRQNPLLTQCSIQWSALPLYSEVQCEVCCRAPVDSELVNAPLPVERKMNSKALH